jgi:hypothetical protein
MKNAKATISPKRRTRNATTIKATSSRAQQRVTRAGAPCSTVVSLPPTSADANPSKSSSQIFSIQDPRAWMACYSRGFQWRIFLDLDTLARTLFQFDRVEEWAYVARDANADRFCEQFGEKTYGEKCRELEKLKRLTNREKSFSALKSKHCATPPKKA